MSGSPRTSSTKTPSWLSHDSASTAATSIYREKISLLFSYVSLSCIGWDADPRKVILGNVNGWFGIPTCMHPLEAIQTSWHQVTLYWLGPAPHPSPDHDAFRKEHD